MKKILLVIMCAAAVPIAAQAQNKHSPASRFPSYAGRVMCGYQGWFRAPGDGAKEGWGHYGFREGPAGAVVHVDFWPDVADYAKTYLTGQAGKMVRGEIPFSEQIPVRSLSGETGHSRP